MKLKKLLEGFAWERESGKPLPTLNDVAKKHNENVNEAMPIGISDRPVDLKSDIDRTWKNSDIVQEDLESYLQMIYLDGNYDTMDDMAAMFNVLSKLAKDYRKKMYYNKFD
jgi:hypothetical protein